MRYRHLTALLISALQEQSDKIVETRESLSALETENADLRQLAEKNAATAERNREFEERLAVLETVLLEDDKLARTGD